MTQKPVALTCGEPSGIAPEITAKAWDKLRDGPAFFWIGDPEHLPSGTNIALISHPREVTDHFGSALPVLPIEFGSPRSLGQPNPEQASNVIRAIGIAVSLTMSGEASAVCTNPISKKALKDGAHFKYPGHTEFLAALGGKSDVVMMLASPELRVVPATIHIPLSEVSSSLTQDALESCIRITHEALIKDFGIQQPRIAIAGLNPHAGEGGTMGSEDQSIIQPVLERLRMEGMNLTGPLPADTMFHQRARRGYDAAICMYHDQALIPIKTLDFDRGVNVTLGLPFVRTSPDHGTAFDIAGTGKADPTSLIEAIKLAAALGDRRANRIGN